jgi:glycosyltransferase involved in cell wall biosynthesis
VTRTRLAYFPRDDFNPYQHLLYRDLEDKRIEVVEGARFNVRWLWKHRRDTDILHFHWPQAFYRVSRRPRSVTKHLSFLKFAYFMLRLAVARSLGYRMVWTIHQVYPHEILHRVLDPLVPLVLSRSCHVLIAHDEHTATLARRHLRLPPGAVHVAPLPSYAGAYGAQRPRAVVRAELGVAETSTVFLFFGGLRAYKNVDVLLDAFTALAAEDVALIIAGLAPDAKIAQRVRAAATADARVKARLELIPASDVPDLFAAADVAVLPRGDGGTSSSLVLALNMGVPVIAAKLPSNEAITRGETAGWMFLPGDVVSLQQCLAVASTDRKALQEKRAGAEQIQATLGWSGDEQMRTALIISGTGQRER